MAFDIPDIDLTKFDSGTDNPSREEFYNMAKALVNLKGAMNFAWDNASLAAALANMGGFLSLTLLPAYYSGDFDIPANVRVNCEGRVVLNGAKFTLQSRAVLDSPHMESGAEIILSGHESQLRNVTNWGGHEVFIEASGDNVIIEASSIRSALIKPSKDTLILVTGDGCVVDGGSIGVGGTPVDESVIHLLGNDCVVGGALAITAPGAHTGIKIGDASTANKGCTVSGVNVGADTVCVGIENGDHHTVGANGLRLLTSTGVGVRLDVSTSKCTVTGNSFRGSGIYQTTQDLGTDNVVANNGIK